MEPLRFIHVCIVPVQRRTKVLKAQPPQKNAMVSVEAQKSREAVDSSHDGRQSDGRVAQGRLSSPQLVSIYPVRWQIYA